jgi:hypothetical protein
MKRWTVAVVSLVLGVVVATGARAQGEQAKTAGADKLNLDFVVDARPASLFIGTEGKKFEAGGTSVSTLYYMPNIDAGVGLQLDKFYVDATVGGGLLVNDGFRSFLLDAQLAASYAFTDAFTLGPRAGVVYFLDPEWLENNAVDFDEGAGFLLGLQMVLGDRISYIVSVDYIDASLDATGAPGTSMSGADLDLSGLAFQFGVRGQF